MDFLIETTKLNFIERPSTEKAEEDGNCKTVPFPHKLITLE
jgi:hypothetical protein